MKKSNKIADYDFSGWVTKNDVLCSDGVVIKKDAFIDNDMGQVPLVWNHNHDRPSGTIGHILLHSRDQGVYGYGYFNDTYEANHAKQLIQNGDVSAMSIAARHIKRDPYNRRDVIHGKIYEVSLVHAGANPEALIDNVIMHADTGEEECIMWIPCAPHANYYPEDEIEHAEENNEMSTIDWDEVTNQLDDEQMQGLVGIIETMTGVDITEDDVPELNEEQSQLVLDYIGECLNGSPDDDDDDEDDDEESDEDDDDYDYDDEDADNGDFDDGDGEGVEHADSDDEDEDDDIDPEELGRQIAESLTDAEKQKVAQYVNTITNGKPDSITEDQMENVMNYISKLLESGDQEVEHMYHNAFSYEDEELMHAAAKAHGNLMDEVMDDARRLGSLKESLRQHEITTSIEELMHGYVEADELQHSISSIDTLLTVETYEGAPTNIHPEKQDVVDSILSAVKTTPKHTVRGRWADLTTDEARALGYIKGDQKIEEVFGTLQRETHPQTIYKMQSIDTDDMLDIDWDVAAYEKAELKTMLRYELARCIFIPDGRASGSRYKVQENKIRPIVTDDPLFVTTIGSTTAANLVDNIITYMATDYKGTGTPSLYIDKVLLSQVRLQKASDGHYLFGNTPAGDTLLADIFGVDKIVKPDFLRGTGKAIIVNLKDYEIAAPNKARSESHEDFDIDFNKHKYLLECRLAGALNTPKSVLVFQAEATATPTYSQATVADEAAFNAGTYYIYFAGEYTKAPFYNNKYTYYTKSEETA